MGSIPGFYRLRRQPALRLVSFPVLILGVIAAPLLSLSQTFVNPLFQSQDPYVALWHGNYYYTESAHNQILIRKSPTLTRLKSQQPVVAWTSPWTGPDGHANLWAPEIHQVAGIWYIYYSADFQSNGNHRLYVLQGGTDPLGPYQPADTGYPNGQLVESTGKWAIDPDVFYGADGQLYITWSCTADGTGTPPQNLCLARMSDALHISSATSRISMPTEAWEKRTGAIQEGPVGFVHDGKTYLTYSASASWTPNDYAVGVLIHSTGDLLDPGSWNKFGPLFDHHGTAYGPGSVVFIPSPDGTETWNVYHAYDRLDCAAWACRTIRMQKVEWDAAGLPLLGYPNNPGIAVKAPSGEMGSLTGWGDSPLGPAAAGVWNYIDASSADTLPQGASSIWQTFRANSNPIAYRVSARVQGGVSGQFGVYASYKDATDHVEAYLDTQMGSFVSSATLAGNPDATRTYPLPPDFDFSQPHLIEVLRCADGQFSYFLDGAFIDQRAFAAGYGQAGLFATSDSVHFRDFSITPTNFGWGDAYGDAAEGLRRDATVLSSGYARGNWTILEGATVESFSTGSNWNTLYQGNPNFENFTVQADVRLTETGTAALPPSYGLIVCHDDRNNQLTLWIDPAQETLSWNAVVRGQSTWESAALPAGFDPNQTHNLTATKTGSQFTFVLDGNCVGQGTYELANGTSGVVTQHARAQFQHFSVVPAASR